MSDEVMQASEVDDRNSSSMPVSETDSGPGSCSEGRKPIAHCVLLPPDPPSSLYFTVSVSSLAFLRSSWSSLVPSREWPLGSSRLDALLAGGSVSRLLRVLYELIQAFLRQPGRSTPLELSEDAVVNNPAMAVQTAIISLEDALEVDLSFINVANIAQGNKEDAINLCQTVRHIHTQRRACE